VLNLQLASGPEHLKVLCLGAHSDDIEIGCAGTLLRWLEEYPNVEVAWAVFCTPGERRAEASASAQALLAAASKQDIILGDFEDAHLPAEFARAKAFLQALKTRVSPEVILTHCLDDAHQDHRLVAELTWQTWRDHLILEYEIPKYEGDLGRPNLYAPLSSEIARRKIDHLLEHFGSQRSKDWFCAETFSGLMRIRGLECRSSSGWAEGFHVRKARL
jgi:LmbE family N-acetylglucosaminyl deacetylase